MNQSPCKDFAVPVEDPYDQPNGALLIRRIPAVNRPPETNQPASRGTLTPATPGQLPDLPDGVDLHPSVASVEDVWSDEGDSPAGSRGCDRRAGAGAEAEVLAPVAAGLVGGDDLAEEVSVHEAAVGVVDEARRPGIGPEIDVDVAVRPTDGVVDDAGCGHAAFLDLKAAGVTHVGQRVATPAP
jgi:hypothetical protein